MNKARKILFTILSLAIIPLSFSAENSILKDTDELYQFKRIVLTGPKDFLNVSKVQSVRSSVKVKELIRRGKKQRSKYFALLMDQNNKELYRIAIGDPFTLHAQHIGYEDEVSMGPNNKVFLELFFPSYIDPSSLEIVMSPKDSLQNRQQLQIFK